MAGQVGVQEYMVTQAQPDMNLASIVSGVAPKYKAQYDSIKMKKLIIYPRSLNCISSTFTDQG